MKRRFAKVSGEGKAANQDLGRIEFGHCSCRGLRHSMEDEICSLLDCPGLQSSGFFGVFDGHGGPQVSEYVSQVLPARIYAKLTHLHTKNRTLRSRARSPTVSSWPPRPNDSTNKHLSSILMESFLETDDLLLDHDNVNSVCCGTTASCVLIVEDYFIFANLGDSRALLSSGGEVVYATSDHKPDNKREKDRILNAGGFVLRGRVCGSLAVARAFGDHCFKESHNGQCDQMVSPKPDVCYIDRNLKTDEFLVIACDGVWDVFTNKDLADLVRDAIQLNISLQNVATRVVEEALRRGSTDNISVIVVTFVDGSIKHYSSQSDTTATRQTSLLPPVSPTQPSLHLETQQQLQQQQQQQHQHQQQKQQQQQQQQQQQRQQLQQQHHYQHHQQHQHFKSLRQPLSHRMGSPVPQKRPAQPEPDTVVVLPALQQGSRKHHHLRNTTLPPLHTRK